MLFSSITFLFVFLPVTLAVYYLAPVQMRNLVMLAASLFFYAWGEPEYLIFMLISITQGYVFGILIERYHDREENNIETEYLKITSFSSVLPLLDRLFNHNFCRRAGCSQLCFKCLYNFIFSEK